MRSSVQILSTLVLVTMGVGCAPKAAHVVETPTLSDPTSNAYDHDAHAAAAVQRDQAWAREVTVLKRECIAVANFDFFWDREKWIYPIYRTGWWTPAQRVVLREKIAQILALTEKRRSFQDDENLQWDWQRASETLGHLDKRAAIEKARDAAEVSK